MPARRARSSTVETSQRSASPSLPSTVRAPVENFAIGLDKSSDMTDPPMPNTAANTTRWLHSPKTSDIGWPMRLNMIDAVTLSAIITAIFVSRKRNMRFMAFIIPYITGGLRHRRSRGICRW